MKKPKRITMPDFEEMNGIMMSNYAETKQNHGVKIAETKQSHDIRLFRNDFSENKQSHDVYLRSNQVVSWCPTAQQPNRIMMSQMSILAATYFLVWPSQQMEVDRGIFPAFMLAANPRVSEIETTSSFADTTRDTCKILGHTDEGLHAAGKTYLTYTHLHDG